MGKPILVTESLKGSHLHGVDTEKIKVISTRGSSAVAFNLASGRYIPNKDLISYIESAKPPVVFLGTDLDAVGTKVATVIGNTLKEKNIPSVRTAFSSMGYVKAGRLYTDKELGAIAAMEAANIRVSDFFKRRFSLPFKVGLKRAVVIGAASELGKRGGAIKTRKGTSTVTAFTKALLSGKQPMEVLRHLNSLYSSGKIEYPRVDVDYYADDYPYDVYAHPPLTSLGYADSLVSSFEEDELPLNKDTIMLALADERLVTPSMVFNYYNTIDEVFEDNLKPKEQYKAFVKECEGIYKNLEVEYREMLKMVHPHAALLKFPKPALGTKKKDRELLEEWLQKIRKQLEKAMEEEEKEKIKQEAVEKERKKVERENLSIPASPSLRESRKENRNLGLN